MTKISVKLDTKNENHQIVIENGLLQKIPEILKAQKFGCKYAIIADSNIAKLYGKKLLTDLKKTGIEAVLVQFKAGEKAKSLAEVENLLNKMIKAKIHRQDAVIALGGGVTGDLAGFAASIYLRGIPLIHIPTSLLAMVDSSIGGKNGVDLTAGKNLAGTIYQPKAIYIDPEILLNIPKVEYINGFAEIIKYGIIKDYDLFCLIENSIKKILNRDLSTLNNIITQCCSIKASIIQKDVQEKNERMLLNYGHTIGHAIERISDYKIRHGEAITMGMKTINEIMVNKRLLNKKQQERINLLFKTIGLPHELNQIYSQKSQLKKLWSIMQNDKKVRKGKINFIITKQIGKSEIYDKITEQDFLNTGTK